jgi:hypothetical protein
MTWLENKERNLNLNFKQNQTCISTQACNYIVRYYLSIVAITVTLWVSQPSPIIEIST